MGWGRSGNGDDASGKRWNERDLSAKRYVYVWADGIHLQARLEDDAQCILVIIGATPEGKKELIGFTDGTARAPTTGAPCCFNPHLLQNCSGVPDFPPGMG
jgi:hypothetical protein